MRGLLRDEGGGMRGRGGAETADDRDPLQPARGGREGKLRQGQDDTQGHETEVLAPRALAPPYRRPGRDVEAAASGALALQTATACAS